MATKEQCSAQVREPGSWPRYHQCERSGALTEDGKPWCRSHAPSVLAVKRTERQQKWEQNNAFERGKYEAPKLRENVSALLAALKAARQEITGYYVDTPTKKATVESIDAAIAEVKKDA